ncbi:MAG: PAS domain-containing sensor histidine kinase [Comamonadaceae bacterium]|nr:MAG: PAS domain-containing sensor histidine kinase [Comamonadaceae bacterium]
MSSLPAPSLATAPSFLPSHRVMSALMGSLDWTATALGALGTWGPALRATVALMLHSDLPMALLWGRAGVMLYNDAYIAIAQQRHPVCLGVSVCDAWPEVAAFNRAVIDQCLDGRTLRYTDQEFTFLRRGTPEQVWLDLNYSPVPGDDGLPAGVLAVLTETTDRVRADRQAQSERERLHAMFAQAPGFMCLLSGPEHVFKHANPAFTQLVGGRDVIGQRVTDALPELADQGFVAQLDAVYTTGQPFVAEGRAARLQRAPGEALQTRYVDFVYQPLRNDAGSVIGIFVQGSDVTDKHAAQEALRLSEQQFRSLAEAIPHPAWNAGPDGKVFWVNECMTQATGLHPDQLMGGDWTATVHPEEAQAALDGWAAARTRGLPYETEMRLRIAPDGDADRDGKRGAREYRWHLVRAVPVRGEDGGIQHWVGTHTDIHDQKSAARMLANLNQLLEQQLAERTADRDRMWQLSTDVMVVTDLTGHVLSANPAFTQVLGWSGGELLGRELRSLEHPDDLHLCAPLLEDTDGPTTLRWESRYRHSDGRYRKLEWTAVKDAQYIHGVGRDVTADRAAAATLRRTEAALYQAQKMETVGQLTGGVAHDFNNLLQVISGNLQLLSRAGRLDERSAKFVANALAGVQRGAKLASQLLAFARRQPLEPRAVHLGRFMAGMQDMLGRTLGETVEISATCEDDIWHCAVDPAQAENALLNLVLNARDAMPQGVGRITLQAANAQLDEAFVRAHPGLEVGPYVMLSVTDNGSGMAPDVLARVFEPFFSTKPDGKGSGLGLSMVYGFVAQSGGHITIDSTQGEGTTVRLYLPCTDAPAEEAPTPAAAPEPRGSGTILVAEDDDAVRMAVVEMLSHLGYQVLQARDAASALAVVESGEAIDLLFTDVVMPGPLRSTELARRTRERLPGVAVLFTSGYTRQAIEHDGRLDAGVELLSKPYTEEALAQKIGAVLAAQRQANQQPAG